MVKSILKPTINYKEQREIDQDDLDFDANMYETEMYKKNVIFALGQPKYNYIDDNICYYPIYLVEDDEIKMYIGVYELLASEQTNILDADGDVDLNKFNKPLLFSFAYAKINGQAPAVEQAHETHEAPAQAADDDVIFISVNDAVKSKSKLWITKFMKDSNYNIMDVKYDGNCFFSMLKLALDENGQDVSIEDMRDLLAANATEELFQNYKTLYDDNNQQEEQLTREIKTITKRHNDLEKTMKKTKDRNLSLSYGKQSEEMIKTHEELKGQRKFVRDLKKDFAFMEGIDNLSMLKLKFKANDYWADTWAISTLERELNIKTIIFSELNYKEGDLINVLQCGQLNDTLLEERGKFEPSFYVLAAHHGGYHYQLITYKNKKSFTFADLPSAVKQLVVDKCLERISGPYSLIPEFIEEKMKAQGQTQVQAEQQAQAQQAHTQAQQVEETISDLYDNATVFRFYSKSNSKPLPGKGEGELLGPEGRAAYDELAKIPEWRRKLANNWKAEFMLDNHRWATVEHYYQANKFKRNNPNFYIQFSLDSPNSEFAKDPAMAKAAGGKSGSIVQPLDGKKKTLALRPKNVVIDPDYYTLPQGSKYSRGEMAMEAAMRAKFTQHADLKTLLVATQKAKLEHVRSGKPAEVYNDLMRVRRDLRQSIS